jgi:hypothetical protein
MIDAIPSPSHGTVSAYGSSKSSSAPYSLNNSIWPSVSSLLSGSSSEWNSTSPFTSTSDYSIAASLDKFDSNIEIVSLSDQDVVYENGASEERFIEETEERYDGSANVTFDWNEFLNFQNVKED